MATFYKGNTYHGTSGNDDFLDSFGHDFYYGYAGADSFYHSTGNDYFDGGAGDDRISYASSPSSVTVYLSTGWAHDGTGGTDSLYSIEDVTGSQFDDMLVGSNDVNVIRGEGGRDRIFAGGGNDQLYADSSDLRVDGGSGNDRMLMTLDVRATVTLNNDGTGTVAAGLNTVRLVSIENLSFAGSDADINVLGNDLDNHVWAGDGDDTIGGGGGNDIVFAHSGDDTIDGGGGNDILFGQEGDNTIDGGDGSDILMAGPGADTLVFDHLGPGSENQLDEVHDFEVGVDLIDLSETAVQDFDDLFTPGDRYMEQVGSDVLLHTSVDADTSILLLNVQMSSLTQDDFLF